MLGEEKEMFRLFSEKRTGARRHNFARIEKKKPASQHTHIPIKEDQDSSHKCDT